MSSERNGSNHLWQEGIVDAISPVHLRMAGIKKNEPTIALEGYIMQSPSQTVVSLTELEHHAHDTLFPRKTAIARVTHATQYLKKQSHPVRIKHFVGTVGGVYDTYYYFTIDNEANKKS